MKEKISKRLIMIILIVTLTVLNIFALAMQIVNAEEASINASTILEGTLEKYINYHISDDDKGTLLQYHLRTGLQYKGESDVFPAKENEITMNIGQIDGKYP